MEPHYGNSNTSNSDTIKFDTAYPKLAKSLSDGRYCYVVQRRISLYITAFCAQRGITANTATGIDMVLAVLAAFFLSQGYYVAGAILIQLFGIWSCVDGEIARLTKTTSSLGDFYDTMTDRTAEFLIIAGLYYSLSQVPAALSWGTTFFAYTGMVFLITSSSEKFRSVYQKNYSKNKYEAFFNWLCAGSDTRLLYLSVGVVAYALSGHVESIQWPVIALSVLLGINFIFRMWKISTLPKEDQSSI